MSEKELKELRSYIGMWTRSKDNKKGTIKDKDGLFKILAKTIMNLNDKLVLLKIFNQRCEVKNSEIRYKCLQLLEYLIDTKKWLASIFELTKYLDPKRSRDLSSWFKNQFIKNIHFYSTQFLSGENIIGLPLPKSYWNILITTFVKIVHNLYNEIDKPTENIWKPDADIKGRLAAFMNMMRAKVPLRCKNRKENLEFAKKCIQKLDSSLKSADQVFIDFEKTIIKTKTFIKEEVPQINTKIDNFEVAIDFIVPDFLTLDQKPEVYEDSLSSDEESNGEDHLDLFREHGLLKNTKNEIIIDLEHIDIKITEENEDTINTAKELFQDLKLFVLPGISEILESLMVISQDDVSIEVKQLLEEILNVQIRLTQLILKFSKIIFLKPDGSKLLNQSISSDDDFESISSSLDELSPRPSLLTQALPWQTSSSTVDPTVKVTISTQRVKRKKQVLNSENSTNNSSSEKSYQGPIILNEDTDETLKKIARSKERLEHFWVRTDNVNSDSSQQDIDLMDDIISTRQSF